jgi:hypothetical protein
MKVWVLQFSDYEESEIIGIYSSEEKATQIMKKNGWSDNSHYDISRWELDKTDKFYA